ncbi:MAG: homoserine O-acetyltransferase, partial [Rhodospirillaceae bacterium]
MKAPYSPGAPWDGNHKPEGWTVELGRRQPLVLDCGAELGPFAIAYQTYGHLNASRSNAILICHALTGDQFVADPHPITGKDGWWHMMVGPGWVLDTERFFLICSNVLGGCMGSSGPKETNPATGAPWALSFPVITVADMVRAQAMLLDYLGIEQLFCVIGGSMGAMQALQWAVS